MTTKRDRETQEIMEDFGVDLDEAERILDEIQYAEPMRKGEIYSSIGGDHYA